MESKTDIPGLRQGKVPEFLQPNPGWFLGLAGMVAAYIIDHVDAPLWLAILTLVVLLVAAGFYPWVEQKRPRKIAFWSLLGAYAISVTMAAIVFRVEKINQSPFDPVVHIEPDEGQVPAFNGQEGLFPITISNGAVDIDHLELTKDYFMVLRDDQGHIKIARLVKAVRASVMPFDVVPLRANQHTEIPVNFNFGARSTAVQLEKSGYQGLVGVRLRAYYRRYADQKDFSAIKVFFVGGAYKFLVAPEQSGVAQVAPFFLSGIELKELLSHIDSDQDWVDPIFQQNVSDRKVTVIFGPTH